jgi:hypothetical protein
MLQGASTYAGFTYILDTVLGSAGGGGKTDRELEFEFTDTPIADRGY